MTTPTTKKEAAKPGVAKRALIQLRVTGFQGKFPAANNLEQAMQQRAAALGYEEVGTVTIDSASTESLKLINVAANAIEPVRLVGILDDVLKTFMGTGYSIELGQVAGPVRTEMKLVRLTRKEYKASKKVEAEKSAKLTDKAGAKPVDAKTAVTKAIKPIATSKLLIGRRTGAYKKLSKKYAIRDASAANIQDRVYNASGTNWAKPNEEAEFIAKFLFAAYGLSAVANGSQLTVSFDSSMPVEELDAIVSKVQVARIPSTKTEENATTMSAWLDAHPGIYVDTQAPDAYYVIGPEDRITDLPTLK